MKLKIDWIGFFVPVDSFKSNSVLSFVTVGRYLQLLAAIYNYRPKVINPIEFWALKLLVDTYKYRLNL